MVELNTKLFTPWTNPETGVTIYLLTEKVAPVQEAFYFVNNSLSEDGRYLWFYCAFPPSGSAAQGRTMGVVDFEDMTVRNFPETQFGSGSPFVEPETGAIYWAMGDTIWKRGPGAKDEVQYVNSLPEDIKEGKAVARLATHLTRSADGKQFFTDSQIGLQYVFGSLPIDGGDYTYWYRFDRNHNHAQFSPTDPKRVLFAQENHPDPLTGLTFRITNRLWTMCEGEKPRAVLREPLWVSHEWWDPDGEHAWCVIRNEAWRVNIHNGEVEVINWPSHTWHAYSSEKADYIIADSNNKFYRGCASSVGFMNRKTGQFVNLVNNPAMENYVGRSYHIDPHPRFVGNDQYVVFTTTLRGEVDLAVAKVDDLIEKTS